MVADELLKARNSKSEASIDSAKLIRNLIDAIAILENGNSLLNLFRDDLAQSCKSIKDSNRIRSIVQVRRSDSANKRSYSNSLPRSSSDWRYRPSSGRGSYNRRMRAPYYRRGRWSSTRPLNPYPLQCQLRPGSSDSSGTNKQSIA